MAGTGTLSRVGWSLESSRPQRHIMRIKSLDSAVSPSLRMDVSSRCRISHSYSDSEGFAKSPHSLARCCRQYSDLHSSEHHRALQGHLRGRVGNSWKHWWQTHSAHSSVGTHAYACSSISSSPAEISSAATTHRPLPSIRSIFILFETVPDMSGAVARFCILVCKRSSNNFEKSKCRSPRGLSFSI